MQGDRQLAAQLDILGFAKLPGIAADLLGDLSDGFASVMRLSEDMPDERATARGVAERVPALRALAERDAVKAACRAALGDDSHVITSDANLLVGDSYWHSDGFYRTPFLRFVIYLEPLEADDGALRFLPGSHRTDTGWQGKPTRNVMQHQEQLGVSGFDLPAAVVPSAPGDVIVFNTNVLHAAWCGGYRRQFGFNVVAAPTDSNAKQDTARYFLNRFVSGSVLLT
ncbi:phytanoyl-CoA dioxygenase family protein [Streptomyces sp. NPDC053253]|uniref:phytanoyl-CoA dioxygenase family protein n=1 Tax=Streptomyces sp. NPDC053253 TaxID=3365699 RepID=UPI0037D08408